MQADGFCVHICVHGHDFKENPDYMDTKVNYVIENKSFFGNPSMPLTDTKLKTLKPTGKAYTVADGQGLYVEVLPTGGIV